MARSPSVSRLNICQARFANRRRKQTSNLAKSHPAQSAERRWEEQMDGWFLAALHAHVTEALAISNATS
jgi:hypothetical protein